MKLDQNYLADMPVTVSGAECFPGRSPLLSVYSDTTLAFLQECGIADAHTIIMYFYITL